MSGQKEQAKPSAEIRDANESERKQMLAVTLKAYREFEAGSPEGFWERYESNISEAVCVTEDIERIVSTVDGEIIGCVLLCKTGSKTKFPEIRLLSVSPQFRNLGIARQLMNECEGRAKSRGYEQIGLHTTSLMNTARAMYERSGYRRDEATDFSPAPGFVVMGYVKDLV